jgi:hypothetical protein
LLVPSLKNSFRECGPQTSASKIWQRQDVLSLIYGRGNPVSNNDPSGHVVETIWDAANIAIGGGSLAYNLYNRNWGDALWDAGGLVVDVGATAIPFIPGGAATVIRAGRAANNALNVVQTANQVQNAFQVVRVGEQLVDTTSLLAQHFDVAAQHGINSYDALRKTVPAGQGLEVHHIIEQRFAPNIGVLETGNMLSVVLTKAEHNVFKNAWRNSIGRINMNSPLRTNNATPDDIWNAAQDIYAGYPEFLEAARITLGVGP